MPFARARQLGSAAALAALAAIAAGCGDGFSPGASVAGTWVLARVDGAALPFSAYQGHGSDDVVADTLVLTEDGTAVSTVAGWHRFNYPGMPSANGPTSARSTGTWTQQGGTVRLTWTTPAGPLSQTATHAGDGLLAADSLLSAGGQPWGYNVSPKRWEWVPAR